ncbi:uncharacterized protein LOC127710472 [Mytilus californianus]|uniref:uncharacterized protein LOC127710472 n=1 Tax=Mytilus californianus TaxID=6549 RepID=UPI002246856B|nr:uncharacterized protein LOC127710472 [Mytilus californianus]
MVVTPPSKKKRLPCRFLEKWQNDLKFSGWLTKSNTGDSHAYCKLWNKDFRIDHGGLNDVNKHTNTAMHIKNLQAQNSTKSASNFFTRPDDDGVTKAEVVFAYSIAEHNIPFSYADHFTKLCKVMFPDSKIATKFACGRTKATQIVKRSLAPALQQDVITNLRTQPFSLAIDESNDRNTDKCLAILVRYFTSDSAKTRFLTMPICNIGISQNIFDQLQQTFANYTIPWTNVLSFMSGNCSVMMGKNNSVMTRIKEQSPDVFDFGCVCHLANLCAVAGVKALPVSIDDMLVDIYYHFHHSSKRKEQYKEFLDFCDVEPSKLLKHATTRWLSLETCVDRTLHHWPALTSYFNSHCEVEKPGRIQRVATQLSDHEIHLYFYFLSFILGPLNNFNTIFQASEARIGYLAAEMKTLLRTFLGKFVKAKLIHTTQDLTTIDYSNPDNQLPNSILSIGPNARGYLYDHSDDISPTVLQRLFSSVRQFYCAVVKKMLTKFPFNDPVVSCLAFLNPAERGNLDFNDTLKIVKRFPVLVPSTQFAALEEEFIDYQVTPADELPKFDSDTRVDSYWAAVSAMTNKITGTARFPLLTRVTRAMCCIPNSNADYERVFSMVKKIHTEHRSSLDNSTLCDLLTTKINSDCACYQLKPDKDLLKTAKKACVAYNKDCGN